MSGSSAPPQVDPPADGWWQSLYDELLAEVLLVRADPAAVEATVDFLVEVLELEPGHRVFDQCCGIGSLSLPLARRQLQVVGVDLVAGYVERGRREATAAGLDVELHTGDAFCFVARPPCHAAINWWTSFGYAPDDETNVEMLRRAYESLLPGGHFALDAMNLSGVLRHFQRDVVTRRQTERGEVTLLRESAIDLAGGTLDKRWTFVQPDGRRTTRRSSVRLYMPHELARLLAAAGFEAVRLFGSVDGEPIDLDSARCICRGRRPRR